MSGLLCKFCGALLEAGNVYCLNCGRAVAESIDVEAETVVSVPVKTTRRTAPLFIALGAIGLIAAVLSLMAWQGWQATRFESPISKLPTANAPINTSVPSPVPRPTQVVATSAPIRPTPQSGAVPVPNPPALQPMPQVIQERQCKDYPQFEDGVPIRAVCKNGNASYWQYDKIFTCRANGGVREWCRDAQPNYQQRRVPVNRATSANATKKP